MTEKERSDVEKAVMFDFRLIVKADNKTSYTKEELLDLIDTVILAKSQENKS